MTATCFADKNALKRLAVNAGIFLFIALMAGGCNTTDQKQTIKKQDNAVLNKLIRLNDLNEQGFAYQQHCLRGGEGISQQYLDNFEISTELLYNAFLKSTDMAPEQVASQIMQRREHVQKLVRAQYKDTGCTSAEAKRSLDHYRKFSSLPKEKIPQLARPDVKL